MLTAGRTDDKFKPCLDGYDWPAANHVYHVLNRAETELRLPTPLPPLGGFKLYHAATNSEYPALGLMNPHLISSNSVTITAPTDPTLW